MCVHGKDLPLDGVVARVKWLEIDCKGVVSQLAQLALADDLTVGSLNRYLAERDLDTLRELNAHLTRRFKRFLGTTPGRFAGRGRSAACRS